MVQLIANNKISFGGKQTLFATIKTKVVTYADGVKIFDVGTFHKISITAKVGTLNILIDLGDILTFQEGETYSAEYPELNTQIISVSPITPDAVIYITYQSI